MPRKKKSRDIKPKAPKRHIEENHDIAMVRPEDLGPVPKTKESFKAKKIDSLNPSVLSGGKKPLFPRSHSK